MLGINDSKGPRTVAQFNADLTTIVNAAKTSGDVVLLSVVPSKATGTVRSPDYAVEAQYRDAAKQLASSLSCGYVEIYNRFESFTVSDAAGYYNTDGIHPTTFGYADVAGAVLGALKTL